MKFIFGVHKFHDAESHKKALVKLIFLLAMVLIPQWVGFLFSVFGDMEGRPFISINDTLIYSFSFLPPAIFMVWDVYDPLDKGTDKENKKRHAVAKSYKPIFIVSLILLVVNVVLYTIQMSLPSDGGDIDIFAKVAVYASFGLVLYVWYATILYDYFEYGSEDFKESARDDVELMRGKFEAMAERGADDE